MMTLLGSYEFLFGALMLCAFQIHKFGEVDDDLRDEVTLPNLRASDFLSHVSYVAVLTLFVAVTLVGFAVLCWVAPAMIGWIQVTSVGTFRFDSIGSRAGPRSIGMARRSRPASMSRQTFVVMR
jgi:hypothetical protein